MVTHYAAFEHLTSGFEEKYQNRLFIVTASSLIEAIILPGNLTGVCIYFESIICHDNRLQPIYDISDIIYRNQTSLCQ